jgi:hypothetical protein
VGEGKFSIRAAAFARIRASDTRTAAGRARMGKDGLRRADLGFRYQDGRRARLVWHVYQGRESGRPIQSNKTYCVIFNFGFGGVGWGVVGWAFRIENNMELKFFQTRLHFVETIFLKRDQKRT